MGNNELDASKFDAMVAESTRLKTLQQKEMSGILRFSGKAAKKYDDYAIEIADFIHQEVIPTKNADLMLTVGLALATSEYEAHKHNEKLEKSLKNSIDEYERAIISRVKNMRTLESFCAYNASYQAKDRTPPYYDSGVAKDAVHKLVAAELARHSNAGKALNLTPGVVKELDAKSDLCNAILDQHKVEQRDWLTKLQARQPETEEERKDRELREEVSAALERARNDTSDPTVVKFNRNCDAIIEQSVSAFAEKIGLSPDGSAPSNTQSATLGQNTDKQKEPKDLSLPKKQSVSR